MMLKTSGSHVLDKPEFNIGDELSEVGSYVLDVQNVPIPPDGGWGWVIVWACFMCNVIVDGIIFSFGIFLVPLDLEFNEGMSKTAWIGSLLSGFYLIAGPFASALANRHGFRTVAIIGSLIACISFIISTFATGVDFLCISYGVMGGIGFGMVYVPAVVSASYYFEKKRALATGIAVCGSGIGTFVFAPLNQYFIDEYSWRGAILIQAGLVLNCTVFAALLRPLKNKPHRKGSLARCGSFEAPSTPLLYRIKKVRDLEMKKSASSSSFQSMTPNRNSHVDMNTSFKPPSLVVTQPNGKISEDQRRKRCTSENPSNYSQRRGSAQLPLLKSALDRWDPRRSSVPTVTSNVGASGILPTLMEDSGESGNIKSDDENIGASKQRIAGGDHYLLPLQPRRRSSAFMSRPHEKRDPMRPFYRDDIFYGGSLRRLSQYNSSISIENYVASVIHIPTVLGTEEEKVIEEESTRFCHCIPTSSLDTISQMLDITLLKKKTFIVLSMSGFMALMGIFIPFMYLKDRAVLEGIDKDKAGFLLSIIGITNTIGRILCGWLSDQPWINALIINNVALTIGGIVIIASPWFNSHALLVFFCCMFGASLACFASLRSILLVDLLGLENLTNAFGLLLLFQGIASSIGAPVAGSFYEATGSYDVTFYIAGILMLLSGVICYPLGYLNRWDNRKDITEDKENRI